MSRRFREGTSREVGGGGVWNRQRKMQELLKAASFILSLLWRDLICIILLSISTCIQDVSLSD